VRSTANTRFSAANPAFSHSNGEPRLGTSQPGLVVFGRGTCKPNSVVCGHSSRRRVTADTHQRPTRRFRQLLEPPCRIGPMRSPAWLFSGASLPIWSCSVWGLPCLRLYRRSGALLPHHFTLTPAGLAVQANLMGLSGSPPERGVAEAVYFLWHWPSMGFKAHVPDVIRHTALRSSDFPPPESAVANPGSDRPVLLPVPSVPRIAIRPLRPRSAAISII